VRPLFLIYHVHLARQYRLYAVTYTIAVPHKSGFSFWNFIAYRIWKLRYWYFRFSGQYIGFSTSGYVGKYLHQFISTAWPQKWGYHAYLVLAVVCYDRLCSWARVYKRSNKQTIMMYAIVWKSLWRCWNWQINAWMMSLFESCRTGLICQLYNAGSSFEGRPITVFKVDVTADNILWWS